MSAEVARHPAASPEEDGDVDMDENLQDVEDSVMTPQQLLSDLTNKILQNSIQAKNFYYASKGAGITYSHEASQKINISTKYAFEYKDLPPPIVPSNNHGSARADVSAAPASAVTVETEDDGEQSSSISASDHDSKQISQLIDNVATASTTQVNTSSSTALVLHSDGANNANLPPGANAVAKTLIDVTNPNSQLILRERELCRIKPKWHAPWKLMRVIAGHTGWVRCMAVDHSNEWFATGSADRTIKIWDLATGNLKLTLTGHISTVRGLAVSSRHPYLFSVGEDKTVKCWDLEQNKVIRSYHGHLSAVYSVAVHPTLDLLITGGRDSTARVWDMRTKAQIRVLGGHTNTVASLGCQAAEPQVISGSHDSTIRLWDIIDGRAMATLTHHKKSIRSLKIHPTEYTFMSGATDNLKVWKCPEGIFLRNLSGHNAIINSVSVNRDNVVASAGDNGSLFMFDWKTGYNFQQIVTPPQPGSLEAESGIFQVDFDMSGSRMITCEADKSIKMYKEDEYATPETHPIDWKPSKKKKRY